MTKEDAQTDVIVTGCGAAGMFAAIRAAQEGARVTVLEQNEKAGKKIYISGKGRCNLTNDSAPEDLLEHVIHGKKFLYSAVYCCDSGSVQRFFTERGCPLKTERGGRVFPLSDKSSDIIRTLTREMERLGVRVRYGAKVQGLLFDEDAREAQAESGAEEKPESRRVTGVQLADGSRMTAKAVIIATGGLSYPATGATGDGYGFAKSAGHTVTKCQPSLVPFETEEQWHRELQGLSLKNVRLWGTKGTVLFVPFSVGKKAQKEPSPLCPQEPSPLCPGPRFDEQGELLFTHFGISGPLVLTASAKLGDALPLHLAIDLKPALTAEELDARLQKELKENAHRQFKNALGKLFPAKLIPVMCMLAERGMPAAGGEKKADGAGDQPGLVRIAPETKAGTLTRAQRLAFGALIKALPVTVTGARGFSEAVVTRGGVQLKEINPSTMESKLCRGLFFAGEVLDCDALTGGYNLQIAWSTGALAGESAAGCRREN